ncbi:MBL fold metallo-hydrolase [Pseudomonas sp. R1-15]|uniref:MBL fold metallo-hydrolase n=1 Tax=Pseudomonas sp. R1-15 TaxID=2817399 RepID=UPI003DA8D3E4
MTMVLQQTAQKDPTNLSRSATEELVPSRYALKVGDVDVLVVSDGVLPLPTSTMSTNADPAARAAWFKDMYLGPDAFDWALNVLVVRSGEQTLLVDAGLGGQFPGFPRAGQFPRRLVAAGIELSSITDVVITHMHMDHIGGLLVEDVKNRLSFPPWGAWRWTGTRFVGWRAPGIIDRRLSRHSTAADISSTIYRLREQARSHTGSSTAADFTAHTDPLWERACSRRGQSIQPFHRQTHRLREQARSHTGSSTAADFRTHMEPCGSELAREEASKFNIFID